MTRVAFKTFGCRSNYADTLELVAGVTSLGASAVDVDKGLGSDVDVLVVNTCTVTDTADKEVYKYVESVRKKNPEIKLVVTGCMAEAWGEEIQNRFPEAKVIGPGSRSKVLDSIIEGRLGVRERENLVQLRKKEDQLRLRRPNHKSISLEDDFPESMAGPGDLMGELRTRSRYHLRIQEGCENRCTFCIIPSTRGVLTSRNREQVIEDLRRLTDLGYNEAILTGTHLGGYGQDLGYSLLELLEEIEELRPIHRVRLSSLDPNDVSFKMIDFLSKSNTFCSHLHICLQAFTESTLKRMNRRYRLGDAEELLWYIHSKFPECCIGSDVITGFPGEDSRELAEGIQTFLSLPLSYLHVFPFSGRQGTPAVRLDGQVEELEKKKRAAAWREVASKRKREFLQSLTTKVLEVVVEARLSREGLVCGTSGEFASVEIKNTGTNWSGVQLKAGTLVQVLVTDVNLNEESLICELLDQGRLI